MNFMYYVKKIIIGSLLFGILLVFQQCKLYNNPAETKQLSEESVPEGFKIPDYWTLGESDTLEVAENWYKSFDDNQLNALIEEAIDTTNLSIIFQLANIDASLAQTKMARTGNSVKVNYSGAYSGNMSTKTSNQFNFTASAPISWEADLWGRIEAGILAADESVLADIYTYSYTRQSIAATVSGLYFQIGALNRSIDVGHEFLDLNIQIAEILRVRKEVGIIDSQEIFLTEAQVNNVKSVIAATENQIQELTRELELVLGRYPENKLEIVWEPKELVPMETISNPMELINRRPDIKANEARVRALFYIKEQAILAKYPSLVLSGSLGLSTLNDLIFGTGASLLGPIFDGGAINSTIEEATAIQKQAVATYGLSILTGFKEVEVSLSSEKLLQEQLSYITKSIEDTKKAYDISVEQYRIGQIDLYYVLQLQSQWLLTELDLVNVLNDIHQQRIQLHLALGGNITAK